MSKVFEDDKGAGSKRARYNSSVKLGAVLRYDFRSAIVIGGTALEKAILYSFNSTKKYLDNCAVIIKEYCMNVLEL